MNLCDLTTRQGIQDRALLELLWSTAIRRGEVARLEIYSPDFSRRILTIVQGKGYEDRVIPVGERALQVVYASTHPAEQREEGKPDRPENNGHNDTTPDTTKGTRDGHNPLQNK